MSGLGWIEPLRPQIIGAIDRQIETVAAQLRTVNRFGNDVAKRLSEYCARGKLIRGALVVAGASLDGESRGDDLGAVEPRIEPPRPVVDLAAAVELVQAFLLIHDDIMDQDALRRGKPAIHEQFRHAMADEGGRDPAHYGSSQAISAGDVAMLLAVNVVAGVDLHETVRLRVIDLLTREIAMVGIAQMADVHFGHSPHEPTEREILSVYRFKTGRYTFSLPLMIGAIAAGVAEPAISQLSVLGEQLGIVFQMKDDEIGLYADQEESGKPAGSDIAENKRTLLRLWLFERAGDGERARLQQIFGRTPVDPDDLSYVRDRAVALGVRAQSAARVDTITQDCERQIDALPDTGMRGKQLLRTISAYNRSRTA